MVFRAGLRDPCTRDVTRFSESVKLFWAGGIFKLLRLNEIPLATQAIILSGFCLYLVTTLLRRGFLALLLFFRWPNYTSGRKTGRKRAGRLRNEICFANFISQPARPFSARFPPASIVWPTKK